MILCSLDHNNLDRDIDPDHKAHIASGSALENRWDTVIVGSKDRTAQGDITAPLITSTDEITSPVYGAFDFEIVLHENSYAINSSGTGMQVALSGVNCDTLVLNTPYAMIQSGAFTLSILPIDGGLYTCMIEITDHGGNVGTYPMSPFIFDATCGNGQLDTLEECDEGRFCDDGTDCTTDSSICPTECRTRFVDGCNPSCEPSRCGDGYIDPL